MAISAEKYIQLWSQAIAAVLSQVAGATFTTEASAEGAADVPSEVSIRFALGKTLAGEQAFTMGKSEALRFAQMLLSESPDPNAEFTKDHVDALGELFRQIAGDVVVRWKASAQSEIELHFQNMEAAAWKPSSSVAFKIKGGEPDLTIVTHLSSEVEKALAAPQAPAPVAAASSAEPAKSRTEISDRNLDLLMDVPLNVKLRFGQRKLPLREVLDLNDGAVVELDQEIEDPAELILGDKVIARGEVVIVDGNYGLRITEVSSPQQRVESARS